MADSPRITARGPIDVTVEGNGQELAADGIISIVVKNALNRIPTAKIALIDGDASEQNFPLSDSEDFKPGADIVINAGYDGKTKAIFEGVIVRHRLRLDSSAGAVLILECRDKAYLMTLDRKNASYIDMSDSDVMTSLVGNYPGLSAKVSSTKVVYNEMVQYYCSDWDYLLSRAEMNGQIVIVQDSVITIGPPEVDKSAVLQLTHGDDVIAFDADIDGRTQFTSVESVSWDSSSQEIASATASPGSDFKQGNITAKALAQEVGSKTYQQQTSAELNKEALACWSESRQLKAEMAKIQGSVTFVGNSDAQVGEVIELNNFGKRFNGEMFISRVEHNIVAGEWSTVANFGLSPDWLIESHNVVAPSASAWTPSISGLHIGVVSKLDSDPEKKFRVQVTVPTLGQQAEGIWARLNRFYSSNQFGAFFIPEIGDEVVLGFMNDDPSHPVILGSLYSSKLPPPYELTAENNIKALVTRSMMKIEFDDEKKILTIWTPAGNQLELNEDEETILLEDQNKNKLTMSSSGIDIESPKDINLSAEGNVSIKAAGTISLDATSDVTLKGSNVTCTADIGLTAKGGASAELSASGQTTVKGAMVLIN